MDTVIGFLSRIYASGTLLEQIFTSAIIALSTFLLAIIGRWLLKLLTAPARRQQRLQKWYDWFDAVLADCHRFASFMESHVQLLESYAADQKQPADRTSQWASAYAEMRTVGPFWSRGSFISEPKDLDVVLQRATSAAHNWGWIISGFEKREPSSSIRTAVGKYFTIPLSSVLSELQTKIAVVEDPHLKSASQRLGLLAKSVAVLEDRAMACFGVT